MPPCRSGRARFPAGQNPRIRSRGMIACCGNAIRQGAVLPLPGIPPAPPLPPPARMAPARPVRRGAVCARADAAAGGSAGPSRGRWRTGCRPHGIRRRPENPDRRSRGDVPSAGPPARPPAVTCLPPAAQGGHGKTPAHAFAFPGRAGAGPAGNASGGGSRGTLAFRKITGQAGAGTPPWGSWLVSSAACRRGAITANAWPKGLPGPHGGQADPCAPAGYRY